MRLVEKKPIKCKTKALPYQYPFPQILGIRWKKTHMICSYISLLSYRTQLIIVSVYEIYNNFIHSLLYIRGRVFVRGSFVRGGGVLSGGVLSVGSFVRGGEFCPGEEFCPAPESNMPLNNEIDTIMYCHFIKISQKAGLSTNWQPIMVLNYPKLTSDVARCMYKMYWTYLKLLHFVQNANCFS